LFVSEKGQQSGNIRAKRIEADNVNTGHYIEGGDPKDIAALIQATQGLRSGDIDTDMLLTKNLNTGLQYIADPSQANVEDLRNEVNSLRSKLKQAIAAQEIADEGDAQDAQESLTAAETELAKPEPKGERVIRKLNEANTILVKSAAAAETAGKLSAQVIKLAPIATVIWQVAQHLFGL
jgi:hypothetical protein